MLWPHWQMLLERNELLERQVLELSNISLQFLNLKQENQHLRELLGSQSRLPDAVLIAELVGVVPTVNTYQIIIDKGLNAGRANGSSGH